MKIPSLVVFDLDFTLWSPEMYELSGPPFKYNEKTGIVKDSRGEIISLFNDVHEILDEICASISHRCHNFSHHCFML